jgi:hypothetical protein
MHEQTLEREDRLLHAVPGDRRTAVVAVAAGDGNRALFESGGAVVVDGGETMNPSTADLVAAIEGADAGEVVLLPNNKNVIMAAEQAADHSSKVVRVVPTTSLQAGLAALVAFDPPRAATNAGSCRGGLILRRRRHVAPGDVHLDGLTSARSVARARGGLRWRAEAATTSCARCSSGCSPSRAAS